MEKLFSAIKSFLWSLAEMLYVRLFNFMVGQGWILCSVYIPNGSTVHLASGYGAVKAMSAVANTSPADATLEASHGVSSGDILEVTSGWSRLTDRIVRASSVGSPTANLLELEGIDASSTVRFPAGSGTGSIREISGWTQLTQILSLQGEGGDQQFHTYQFLEGDSERRIPTHKTAVGMQIEVADDDTLAGYILVKEANDDREPRAVRITKPNGGLIFFSAFLTLAPMPQLDINVLARARITFSLENPEPTKYAS